MSGKEPSTNEPRIGRLSVCGQRPRNEYDHHKTAATVNVIMRLISAPSLTKQPQWLLLL